MINVNGYGNGNGNGFENGNEDDVIYGSNGNSKGFSPLSSSSSPHRYIEHHVSKMDTLAGVAIRYGVEVADLKKMNGLVTDHQMYALKTLKIPLPGRHPPSCLSNGDSSARPCSSDQTPSRQINSDPINSFQSLKLTPDSKLSPAMSSLRDYYGLHGRRFSYEGCEMANYKKYNKESTDSQTTESFPTSSRLNPPLSHHRRSRSAANGFNTKEDELANNIRTSYRKWIGKLNIRPPKTEEYRTPEKLLKEENGSGGWFLAITGKGLALRTKAGSRTNLASEGEPGCINGFPNNLGESIVGGSSSGVRKSSSTPIFQDQDVDGNVSIWNTSNWSLKSDILAALSNPIFDNLPKPIIRIISKAD